MTQHNQEEQAMKINHQIAQHNSKLLRFMAAFIGVFATQFAMAAGGLDAATTEVTDIKVWAYSILGVLVFCYLIYHVVMALLDRKSWGDVLLAVGQVAVAGGIIAAGEWAWSIWGS